MSTGDGELDRVLGGGLVPGSIVLLGGEPGIGKSTLTLQTILNMHDRRVLYVSGEESAHQLKMRAERLAPKAAADELLITADTVVMLEGRVLGKPHDREDAIRMLTDLSGRTHEVITGVTLATVESQKSFASVSRVTFASLHPDDIIHYVDHYRPFDKAGAYGIQEWIGFIGVTRIEGSYFNVMGLPVQRLYEELRRFCGVDLTK